jgi:hypothetical protein
VEGGAVEGCLLDPTAVVAVAEEHKARTTVEHRTTTEEHRASGHHRI